MLHCFEVSNCTTRFSLPSDERHTVPVRAAFGVENHASVCWPKNQQFYCTQCQIPPKTQTDKRTKRRTDKRQESNLVHFSLKMWHLLAIIFNDFPPDKQRPEFREFIGRSWNFFIISPLNFYEVSRFVPLIYDGRSWPTQWTNGHVSVRLSLRWSLTL